MKAVVFAQYGSPDSLAVREVAKPVPKADEVLVQVCAVSLNSWDWDLLRGDWVNRLLFGLRRPKIKTLGADISGRVAALGAKAGAFKVGDAVWGDLSVCGWGGLAEYVCVPIGALAPMPARLDFSSAAAVPQAGLLALQGLRDSGRIRSGQKVLINGAGGGVGTFAVQLAKAFGAEVTGVDAANKLERVRAIGADHVIDYAREDLTRTGRRYDLILDVMTKRPVSDYVGALVPGGVYVTVGGPVRRLLQALLLGPWIRWTTGRSIRILALRPNDGLDVLKELIEAGTITPVVDGPYPLDEVAAAFRHLGSGRHKGKIVITVA